MEHPIIFSTPMVQAILEGRKTQTRRIVKGTPFKWLNTEGFAPHYVASPENDLCPYGKVDDVLWVRESFHEDTAGFLYKADYSEEALRIVQSNPDTRMLWKPSIHMPRTAARIFLQVMSIRIECVQEISNDDATKEGVNSDYAFTILWDQINGKRASWESNPWVWVIEFKKIDK